MKIIFLVVLLFLWSSIGAQVRPEYSGMWYNPDQDGHGLSLEVLDAERSVGFWYRYDESGEPEWWLLKGTNHAATTEFGPEFGPYMKLEAYRFHGMIPGVWDPATNTRVHVTDLVIHFHDCNNITVTVFEPWSMSGIEMTRLTHIAGLKCVDPVPPSLEELVGDWIVSIGFGHAVPTTVTPEGSFEFVSDDLACSWRGQIGYELTGSPMFHVMVTEKTPGCGDMLYSTEYPVLHREHAVCFRPPLWWPEPCKDYDEVLELEICAGDPCDLGGLVLYRDLPK